MANSLVSIPFNRLSAYNAGGLDVYLREISSIPLLEAEEERELARRFRENGEIEAVQKLIIANLRFVVHIARTYSGYGLALSDLVQEGNIGLMKAAHRFNPSVGSRLISFAAYWIRAGIHDFVIRNWRIVTVATTKAQRKLFFKLRSMKKKAGWFTNSEAAALAEELKVSKRDVLEMEGRLSARDLSLSVESDDDGAAPAPSPAQWLEAADADPADTVIENSTLISQRAQLRKGLAALDERSRDIVEQRWLAAKKTTLQTLATRYKLSVERIRQIEAGAIQKLRSSFDLEVA